MTAKRLTPVVGKSYKAIVDHGSTYGIHRYNVVCVSLKMRIGDKVCGSFAFKSLFGNLEEILTMWHDDERGNWCWSSYTVLARDPVSLKKAKKVTLGKFRLAAIK